MLATNTHRDMLRFHARDDTCELSRMDIEFIRMAARLDCPKAGRSCHFIEIPLVEKRQMAEQVETKKKLRHTIMNEDIPRYLLPEVIFADGNPRKLQKRV